MVSLFIAWVKSFFEEPSSKIDKVLKNLPYVDFHYIPGGNSPNSDKVQAWLYGNMVFEYYWIDGEEAWSGSDLGTLHTAFNEYMESGATAPSVKTL